MDLSPPTPPFLGQDAGSHRLFGIHEGESVMDDRFRETGEPIIFNIHLILICVSDPLHVLLFLLFCVSDKSSIKYIYTHSIEGKHVKESSIKMLDQ